MEINAGKFRKSLPHVIPKRLPPHSPYMRVKRDPTRLQRQCRFPGLSVHSGCPQGGGTPCLAGLGM